MNTLEKDALKGLSNSVVSIEGNVLTLTYDLGDSNDAERFASKFDKAAENTDLQVTSLELLYDEEDEDFPEWTIGNSELTINDNTSFEDVKTFIEFVDSI